MPSLGRQRWHGDTYEDHRQAVGGSAGLAKRCRRLFAGVNLMFGLDSCSQMAFIWESHHAALRLTETMKKADG